MIAEHSHLHLTTMSSNALLPADVLESMISRPSQAFFDSENGIDATALLGTYEFPTHFRLRESETDQPVSVYRQPATGEPFRALLLGEIQSMDCLRGETAKASLHK
jgi:hypothetical protein